MKRSICIISYVFPKASRPTLGTFVLEESKALCREGNKVIVLTGGDYKDKDFEKMDGVNVYRIKNKALMHLSFYNKILRLNKKYNFDVLHFHFIGPLTLFCNLAAKSIKRPFVITTYGLDSYPRPKFRNFDILSKKFFTMLADKIICYSNFTKSIVNYFDEKKLIVINPGVNLKRLKTTKSRKEMIKDLNLKNSYILLSVSNIVKRKGHDTILKAMQIVKKKIKNLMYVIVGEDTGDYKEDLDKLIRKLNLEQNVTFVGPKKDNELANYYNLCNIFVLMSRTIPEQAGVEGFGVVYIEAAALGKPVIGGKSGGTFDAVADGKTGFLVEPEDYGKLAEKIVLLLKNKKLRGRMGNAGRKRVLRKFLWEHSAQKILRVYDELIK